MARGLGNDKPGPSWGLWGLCYDFISTDTVGKEHFHPLSPPRTDTRDYNFEVRNHSGGQGIGHLQTANQLLSGRPSQKKVLVVSIFRTIIHDLMCGE